MRIKSRVNALSKKGKTKVAFLGKFLEILNRCFKMLLDAARAHVSSVNGLRFQKKWQSHCEQNRKWITSVKRIKWELYFLKNYFLKRTLEFFITSVTFPIDLIRIITLIHSFSFSSLATTKIWNGEMITFCGCLSLYQLFQNVLINDKIFYWDMI